MSDTVTIFDPQGNRGEIPHDQLMAAIKAGAMPAVIVRSPDGKEGYVPANRTHEAYMAGGQIVPIQDQEIKHPGFWGSLWGDIKSLPDAITGPDPLADPRVSDAEKNQIVAQQQAQAAATNQARTQAHGQGYSLASTAGEMLGVPVSGMEQSAQQGDVGGVFGHAATAPTVMAATAGLTKAGSAAMDIPLSKATAPVRAAIRGANLGLERAPGTVGSGIGASVGGYLGGHIGAEVGGLAGGMAGRELLPSLRIPGENIGLPNRVTGGPVNAPQYVPGQAGSMAASVAPVPPAPPPVAPAVSSLRDLSNFPTAASRAASDAAFARMNPTEAMPEGMTPQEKEIWQERLFGEKPTGDIGSKVRAANPEPTRAEVKAAQNKQTGQLSDLLDQSLGVKKPIPGVKLKNQPAAQAAAESAVPEGHTPVESSALRSYKYDANAREFTAATRGGDTQYVYGDVSPEGVDKFEKADSKGKAWQDIRNEGTLVAKIVNGKRIPIKPARVAEPSAATGDLSDLLKQSVQAVKAKKLAEGTP